MGTENARAHNHALCLVVADNHPDSADALALLLQADGHRVHIALDGEQALQLIATQRPHIALLDIGMPVLDGLQIAERVRAQPWGSTVRMVAITGWAQPQIKERCRKAGYDTHWIKPVAYQAVSTLCREVAAKLMRS